MFGNPDLPDESGFDFISLEADVLDARVGDWFGTMFLAIGAVSLFAAAIGIVDYVSRLVADVVRVATPRAAAVDREPPVLRGRLDDGDRRQPDPAGGLRPAAGADHDLDRARRRDHGRLLVPAGGDQPALPAGELKLRGYRLGIMSSRSLCSA